MFGRKKDKEVRSVTLFSDLDVGDLVVFKPRDVLPEGVSDETLTVEKVGTYDYFGTLASDFTLGHSSGLKVSASYNSEDETITLGYKMKRSVVLSIFGGSEFGQVFDEDLDSVVLDSNLENVSGDLKPWIADSYTRSVVAGSAYYYDEDRRGNGISSDEDSAENFIYYELEGSNEVSSISVEVWADGETDVFCEITVKSSVVETFLNHG